MKAGREAGREAERRAVRQYRLRGYRILGVNVWVGGYELDVVARRGRQLVFVEVKSKSSGRFGSALEMVGPEKVRRIRRAAASYLAAHRELRGLPVRFDVVAEQAGRMRRFRSAF